MKIHAAKLIHSPRLQAVFNALLSGPLTTMQIIKIANVCAVNSIVSELRANGIDIECKCLKRGVFEYRIAK